MSIGDIRSLDVSMLRVFDALIREKNVSRAAARLFLSQSAVSGTLKRLREVFNDQLFTRTAVGVQPTPHAIELAPHVEAALIHIQRLLNVGRDFDPTSSDRILRIAGSDHSCRTMLPLLNNFLQQNQSRIRLFWESPDYLAISERLQKGYVDVALLPRINSWPADVEVDLLYEDEYVLVTNRHNFQHFDQEISLDEYCAAKHLVLAQGRSELEDAIDHALNAAGRTWNAVAAVPTFGSMVDIVSCTDLFSVFPRRVAQHYSSCLAIHRLPFALPRYRLFICWSERANEDLAVQWIKNEMRRIACGVVAPTEALGE